MTYKAIIIDGVDVFLLGDHIAKASACTIFERDARGFGAQDLVDVIAVIKLVIKTLGHFYNLCRITILHDDQMIRLKEWAPHLEEIQVSDRWNNNVKFISQRHLH